MTEEPTTYIDPRPIFDDIAFQLARYEMLRDINHELEAEELQLAHTEARDAVYHLRMSRWFGGRASAHAETVETLRTIIITHKP